MLGNLFGTIVNIVLAPLFILVLKLGVRGVAICYGAGKCCSLGMLYFIYTESESKSYLKSEICPIESLGNLKNAGAWTPQHFGSGLSWLGDKLGLRNSSNPVEKANYLLVAQRQKHNWMAWFPQGSGALAAIEMIYQNDQADI